jgi:hypothetical protein
MNKGLVMNRLVLALGVLLALAGAYFIYAGSGIIQIERGWTQVISGTVALTGGIVTIALAAVLDRLDALVGLRSETARPAEAPRPAPKRETVAKPQFSPAPVAAAIGPLSIAENIPETSPFEPPPISPLADEPERAFREPVRAEPEFSDAPTAAVKPAEPAETVELPQPAMPLRPIFGRGGFRPVPASFLTSHEPALPELKSGEQTAAPVQPDIRAELRPTVEPDAPLAGEPIAEPEKAPTRAAPAAPAEPPSVIGRYSAAGTSYVMYSDGSIDAESPSGIKHFASMAELKDFLSR